MKENDKTTLKISLILIGIFILIVTLFLALCNHVANTTQKSYKELDEKSAQYNGQFSSYYLREIGVTILVDNVNGVEYIRTNTGIVKREKTNK